MASPTRAAPGDGAKTGETGAYDATLDFFSDKFDPLKALYTPGLQPPVVDARLHDNLSMFEATQKAKAAADPKPSREVAAPLAGTSTSSERRWLPHQLPIQTERKERRNILTRMENIEGPLMLLKKCKDERLRIKVWTRHSHGIRGYCLAYVTAFDKHWNMSLETVTEVWTRPKRRKIPAVGGASEGKLSKPTGISPPKIIVTKSDKKTETCERCVDQFVIRGEHVAFVQILE